MTGEALFEIALGLALGVYALVSAYRATQTGEIYGPGDDPGLLNSRKEPDAFVNQVALYFLDIRGFSWLSSRQGWKSL